MKLISRIVAAVRQFLASNAATIGLSPKLVGAAITGLLIQGLNEVGVIDPSAQVLGILTVVGMSIAAWLFGPGKVVPVEGPPVGGSDGLLSEEARKDIERAAK